MNLEALIALALFALVSSITPGPNNLMLMSSGANFGYKKTIPHMLGVSLGFAFMLLLVGIGLVQLFNQYPVSYDILKVVSVAYLLYLAFKIATSASVKDSNDDKNKPFTFLEAAAFQWVNPKAWTMALTSISVYSPSQDIESIAIVALVFALVNLPSVSCWTLLGLELRVILSSNARLRVFNYIMAGLLVLSLYPVLFGP
ncbi:MAG: threonine/homoserine/homoserine lactone efflux protein [Polaribacter sp.]|jgi:threonine/homoserine/homoserine lactone efflux protein